MSQPLENIRVLDLSRFIAGPFCAMLLADMGADVIKVERPGGEDARQNSPFVNGHSVYTLLYHRNKRAVTINTRSPRGLALLKKLVCWADVIVENYRPGTMEQMGLGYHDLKALNPDIILTSVSGFGQTGPYRDRALFDCIAQAMSGLMARNGEPDDPPLLANMYVGDYTSGLYAAFATMVAIFHRERTGEGQHIDVAVLDSLFSCTGTAVPAYLLLREVMPRLGNRDAFAAPANAFRAKDGYVYLHGGTQPLFRRLASIMNRPDLLDDPRFRTNADRVADVDAIEAIVNDWVGQQTIDEVSAKLEEAGIPFGPVAETSQVADNPQLRAREMIVEFDHPEAGKVSVLGNPIKMSRTPVTMRSAPPLVGQHNEDVFTGLLGLDPEELESLQSEGAI